MYANWFMIDDDLTNELDRLDGGLRNYVDDLKGEHMRIASAEEISEFKAYQRQKSKNVKTNISVSPFFKGDGNFDDFTYSYFIGAFSDKYRYTRGTESDLILIAERFGFGVEINLQISNIKTSLKGGFGAIGAAVDMELADVQYDYKIKSMPKGDYEELLPPVGDFNSDAIRKFSVMISKLKSYYSNGITDLDLSAMEILLVNSVKEEGTENAKSYYYGAMSIVQELSLEQSIKRGRNSSKIYNEDAIQYVYSRCGLSSIEEKPMTKNITIAKQFLNG